MKEVNLKQGTPEWLSFRKTKFTASDAPVVLGFSKYKTRDQLLKEKSTGLVEEVSPALQARFDAGHKTEALARTILENELGDELYPVTGYHDTDQNIAASLDGMDMLGEYLFEHKLFNEKLIDFIECNKDLPETHWPQLEQQLYVSGAQFCVFIVSDGTADKRKVFNYFSKPERLQSVLAAWAQFAIDLKTYEVPAQKNALEVKRIDALPTLLIEINGSVKSSNLATYKDTLLARIDSINTELATDQDFADAESMVKFCKKAEDELKTAEKLVLGQVTDINEAINTIQELASSMRSKRLALDKSVKARKEQIKLEMLQAADKSLTEHIEQLGESLGASYLPIIQSGFADAIKGKKNIDSMQSAINDQLAQCKIRLNAMAEVVRANLKTYQELAIDFGSLFPDLNQLVNEQPQAFKGLVIGRIAEFKEAKAAKDAEIQRQAELKAQQETQSPIVKPELGIVNALSETIANKDPVADAEPSQEFVEASDAIPAHADTTKLSDLLWGIKQLQIPQCSEPVNQQAITECMTLLNQAGEALAAAISNTQAA